MNVEKNGKKANGLKVGDFIYSEEAKTAYQIIKTDNFEIGILDIETGNMCGVYSDVENARDSFSSNYINIIPSEDVTITLKSHNWR